MTITINNMFFTNFTPTYVTNNLSFNVDAGNPASYPGSGTTWTDLGPSALSGSFYNSPTYSSSTGGYISFSGSNNVQWPYNSSAFNFGTGDFTCEVWYNKQSVPSYPRLLALGAYGTGGNFEIECHNNYALYLHINGSYQSYGATLNTNSWYQVV